MKECSELKPRLSFAWQPAWLKCTIRDRQVRGREAGDSDPARLHRLKTG